MGLNRLTPIEAIIYENGKKVAIETLGQIKVDQYNRVSLKTIKHYINIAQYIAGDRDYELTVDGKQVMILYENGKYAYLRG